MSDKKLDGAFVQKLHDLGIHKSDDGLKPPDFQSELGSLINRYSKENESNTPDFILAQYLIGCLETFNAAVKRREDWYCSFIPSDPPCGDPHSGL